MARASVSAASTAVPGPVRTCIGCRERTTKSELLRVTVGSDAEGRPAAVPDPSAVRPGRGAHLHPTVACYDLAVRRRAFGRALRAVSPLDSTPVATYLASPAGTTDSKTDRPTDQELEQ
ncbi:MAG: YlxR family protein [Nocardioides sp.]